jgi:predicted permease
MGIIDIVDSVRRDLRYALRGLLRRPTFTFAAVLTLALGLGATTAIFSVVYSVLIKPLPYPNADQLVRIRHEIAGQAEPGGSEPSMFAAYRDGNRTLAALGLWQEGTETMVDNGEPERVRALRVSDGALQALDVQPALGRSFTQSEHGAAADGPAPVLISHAFWQRRFGGDAAVLGREISIVAQERAGTLPPLPESQIVGIMPPDFRFLDMTPQPDVILAVRLDPQAEGYIAGNFNYHALARLAPGVTLDEAQTDLQRLLTNWQNTWPLPSWAVGVTRETVTNLRMAPVMRPLKDDLVGDIASTLWVLMGAIGGVLLVACANIANLMLVRTEARRPELAMRAALGARPGRIARELLVESICLGAAGCAVGLALAYAGRELLVAMAPSNLPRLQEIAVHPPVLAFSIAVALATTLLFGSFTALKHALHVDAPATGAARGASASRDRSRVRSALVVVQVALALVLVGSSALMIRTFAALRDVDPGFSDPATIQTVRVWNPVFYADTARNLNAQREMLDKLSALPGVTSAGFASTLPMEGQTSIAPIVFDGQAVPAGSMPASRRHKHVSPGYFQTMGTRIIAGRGMTWGDVETGGRVALISEDLARELAPDPAGAVGKRIKTYLETDDWREVIGVVQNVRENGLNEAAPSMVYWPALVENMFGSPAIAATNPAFVIRSERADTATFLAEIRQAIRSVDASLPISNERTMRDLYSGSLARTSFVLVLLAIAGGMALVLGVVGIYGVIAYVVSQRAREIGIRAALGAEPRQLKGTFLLHGLALSAVGAAVGLVAAVALGRLMSSVLFGVSPLDPIAYVAAVGVTITAAALASYLPARRAAMINPIETLRAE